MRNYVLIVCSALCCSAAILLQNQNSPILSLILEFLMYAGFIGAITSYLDVIPIAHKEVI